MSPSGTMYALSSVRLKGRKPADCRRLGLNVALPPNFVEKLHFHRGPENFRAVQEQLQFLAEGVAKNRLLPSGVR